LLLKNNLQEENQLLKNNLIDLNSFDSEKYKKLDRTLITKSDKKTIAKQNLWNKLQIQTSASPEHRSCDGRNFPIATHPNRNNKVILIINDERLCNTYKLK
jgi:hypothetical protein